MERTRWYKDRVFYHIWPRSFCDGNGDGVGDLPGVLNKLDYICSLGCDGIWFSPLYPSPGIDCGYDISDYLDIDKQYGGMEAFRRVLNGAHARGMKVIMDLVVNHTSDAHEWFQKSRRRIDPYTHYYIWRPARPGGRLPNNWDSIFEGKAWAWDSLREEYYLHLYSIKQPDLNMDNPLVREEVKKIMRFWLSQGVDGFREDVITFISKRDGLPNDYFMPVIRGLGHYNHGPRIHDYLREFKRDALDGYDCFTIGEAPLVTPRRALDYINEADGQLDAMIQFQSMNADCFLVDYAALPFSARRLKHAFGKWQRTLEGRAWNMLYLENHDHPRVISRYGSERYRVESGKMLACSYLFQQGTPFVYQGQELGMVNWRPENASAYEDVQTRWHYENTLARLLPSEMVPPRLTGQRAHPHAVERCGERRLHHRPPLVPHQRKLSERQRSRAGARPGFAAELLPQGDFHSQTPERHSRRALHRPQQMVRQPLCIFQSAGAGARAGHLLVRRAPGALFRA